MNANEIMSIYDEVDSAGVEYSSESREIHSVLSAMDDALDTDLPDVLQRIADDGHAYSLHAYVKNELLALRRILRDNPNMYDHYLGLLEASLFNDLKATQKRISEQLAKLKLQ